MFTQRVIPNSGAEGIGFIRSLVNKSPTESDTLVIRYRVNGAFICSVHLRQVFNETHQLPMELSITAGILTILKNKAPALVLIFLVISWQFFELDQFLLNFLCKDKFRKSDVLTFPFVSTSPTLFDMIYSFTQMELIPFVLL